MFSGPVMHHHRKRGMPNEAGAKAPKSVKSLLDFLLQNTKGGTTQWKPNF